MKAILFDLDDTLLNRDHAVDNLFYIILEKYYGAIQGMLKKDMLEKFKEYDKRDYGIADKTNVLSSFFDAFPSTFQLHRHDMQDFWDQQFPYCFSIDQHMLKVLQTIKKQVQVGIITNGSTLRQKAKITHTGLASYFDVILISEEVGLTKPDKRIFELALHQLQVQPNEALFVGDDLAKDIAGCQQARMKGIWYNPHRLTNPTDIKPDAVIHSFEQLIKGRALFN
ncbi:HAD family hydrolase [Lysinibacillus sp. OL1_EC]|uniref:HAD family hydrolase n=1 Tax=unclassified Lysinibacillus TaxID=2636778 RepID=UPI0010401B70|nr:MULTISPECIES: HAD family hydrolase [unclassified Lysinibacillus]MCM0623167.1 HAD family hydrolase [Lysinibacillus sp. OL1_EC]TBV89916.1 HAD family hydrolase [Lysinibacillus sp. OL1]